MGNFVLARLIEISTSGILLVTAERLDGKITYHTEE